MNRDPFDTDGPCCVNLRHPVYADTMAAHALDLRLAVTALGRVLADAYYMPQAVAWLDRQLGRLIRKEAREG